MVTATMALAALLALGGTPAHADSGAAVRLDRLEEGHGHRFVHRA